MRITACSDRETVVWYMVFGNYREAARDAFAATYDQLFALRIFIANRTNCLSRDHHSPQSTKGARVLCLCLIFDLHIPYSDRYEHFHTHTKMHCVRPTKWLVSGDRTLGHPNTCAPPKMIYDRFKSRSFAQNEVGPHMCASVEAMEIREAHGVSDSRESVIEKCVFNNKFTRSYK